MTWKKFRKPIDPLSPAGISCSILARLLKPEALRQPGVWGRELKILSKLRKSYPDEVFWLNLRPHEKLESLSYLLTENGQAALREFWVTHQLEKEDLLKWVDKCGILDSLTDSGEAPKTEVKPKKLSMAEWADKE
jgi:hypothetical protein